MHLGICEISVSGDKLAEDLTLMTPVEWLLLDEHVRGDIRIGVYTTRYVWGKATFFEKEIFLRKLYESIPEAHKEHIISIHIPSQEAMERYMPLSLRPAHCLRLIRSEGSDSMTIVKEPSPWWTMNCMLGDGLAPIVTEDGALTVLDGCYEGVAGFRPFMLVNLSSRDGDPFD